LILTAQIPLLAENESVFTPRYSFPAVAVTRMEVPTSKGRPLPILAMRDQQGRCGAGNWELCAA
jgi:hypothetical protein